MHDDNELKRRDFSKPIFFIAIAFSLFQLWTAAYSPLSSIIVRSVHVGFLLLMVFGLSAHASKSKSAKIYLWALGILSFILAFYHWYFESDMILRAGDPNQMDLIVGVVIVVLVFEGARRQMGLALPIICASFLLYALFGRSLPDVIQHRGYDFIQVVEQMFMGTEGIYGIPTYVSSSYIFLFILFGAFLEKAGMVQLFTDIAMGTVGHKRGGPAKVSVISSGLMGTINGSGVANVVTTGQFTIPLMKKFGYKPAFAGAVEATASMGGQIMPPVMGAVAFIMAETIDVPYIEVVTAAIIPALLYFVTVFLMVHLEAGRLNLHGIDKSECPNAWHTIKAGWYLFLPLGVLVFLLFSGYTPLFAGTVGLALTAILLLGQPIAARLSVNALRVVFWIIIGFAASAFFKWGIDAVVILILLMIGVNFFAKGGRNTLNICVHSLADGARHAVGVGIACALVGVIIGVTTLTGVATTFAGVIIDLGQSSLFLSLVLTMLTCLVLGMGIPTIPNYIITSSLAAPALLELGVPLIVSHMFVFYFGIMADLTPPVALAAFAASPIAKASGLRIGMNCLRIAIAGFVVPFMAVYSPMIMLQGVDSLSALPEFAWDILKVLIAIGLWGAASIGFLFKKLSVIERVIATIAAICLIVPHLSINLAGLGLAAFFIVGFMLNLKKQKAV